MKTLIDQIQKDLDTRNISDIEKIDNLLFFKADSIPFWGRLTKTGKLKKNSIRVES